LSRVPAAAVGVLDRRLLKRSRFLICICQQRLRFIIRSLEASPRFPMELIGQYAARGLCRMDSDSVWTGVITLNCRGHLRFRDNRGFYWRPSTGSACTLLICRGHP